MKINLHYIYFGILILLVLLLSFSYHPYVLKTSNVNDNSILTIYIFFIYSLLFCLTFKIKNFFKAKVILNLSLLILVFIGMLSIVIILGYDINIFNEIRPLIITTVAITIGWQLKLSNKEFLCILILYSLAVLFTSIQNIMINIGSFIIKEQYAVKLKNCIGVMLATSSIIFYSLAFNKNLNRLYRLILLLLSIISLLSLLTLRARTATLSVFMVIIFLLFKRYNIKNKNILNSIFIAFLSLTIIYFVLPASIKDFIYNSFTLNTSQNITTGRIDRNILALNYLSDNPFVGNLNKTGNVPLIHNYILLQIYKYGIIFSSGILLFYFYLLYIIINGVFKKNLFELKQIGFTIMLVPFIISFAEPSIPFGPGTVNVFNFIIFGITLKYNFNKLDK